MSAPTAPASKPRRSFWGRLTIVLSLAVITCNLWLVTKLLETHREVTSQHDFYRLCQGTAPANQRAIWFSALAADDHSEWRSAALRGLELARCNLSGRKLANADFTGSDFSDSNLANAELKRTKLDLCDCSRVNFETADLDNAQFFKARLNNADFRGAKMVAINMEQCSGQSVSFVRADLTGAYMSMAVLTKCDFTGADLSGANFEGAVLTGSNLALSNLQDSKVKDTDLTGTNWWRARGLTLVQKANLMERFPATADDTEARQRDFALWKAGFIGEN